jgi:hypothetical protein
LITEAQSLKELEMRKVLKQLKTNLENAPTTFW